MSSQPDLEFTKDSEWINQRERYWKPLEADLKENNRSAKVAQFKQLYLTGTCDDIPTLRNAERSGAIVIYYPLQTAEGWDFAFQNEYLKPELFKKFFYDSLENTYKNWMPSEEVQLRFFDYFHPEIYQQVVKSRVPVGRDQKVVELDVDPYDLFDRMCGCIGSYLRKGYPTILMKRLDYFFSCLDALGDLANSDSKSVEYCIYFIRRFLNNYFEFNPKVILDDQSQQIAFLKRFYDHVANNPVDPSIKKIWQEVVSEHE
ncbi:hypothetical protein ACJJIQ_05930 [Microbulbifer sp. ANSA003]|uniref:hypothetical protein n=1 Tax=Microbulbifer sp. ANSA003 TaxID=3243360 RepID=UPI0040434A9C